jgi:hypothetical protein
MIQEMFVLDLFLVTAWRMHFAGTQADSHVLEQQAL